MASRQEVIQIQVPKPRPSYLEAWHLRTVIIPRRSITGRLLWGTVLRRRNNRRWFYKKYAKSVGSKKYFASAGAHWWTEVVGTTVALIELPRPVTLYRSRSQYASGRASVTSEACH